MRVRWLGMVAVHQGSPNFAVLSAHCSLRIFCSCMQVHNSYFMKTKAPVIMFVQKTPLDTQMGNYTTHTDFWQPGKSNKYLKQAATRYCQILLQIKEKRTATNLTLAKADKGRTIVIIDRNTYLQKVDEFIQENQFIKINIDPSEKYHEEVQHIIHACNNLTNKHLHKYITQIKLKAPALNARIKIHKETTTIETLIKPQCAVNLSIQ